MRIGATTGLELRRGLLILVALPFAAAAVGADPYLIASGDEGGILRGGAARRLEDVIAAVRRQPADEGASGESTPASSNATAEQPADPEEGSGDAASSAGNSTTEQLADPEDMWEEEEQPNLTEAPTQVPEASGGGDTRIVNGQATTEAVPSYVMLLSNRQNPFCGGSLISYRYVLTAAHCLDDMTADQVSIRTLVHSKGVIDSGEDLVDSIFGGDDDRWWEAQIKVKSFTIHENWNGFDQEDIALMELDQLVSVEAFENRAALASPEFSRQAKAKPEGVPLQACGFGRLDTDMPGSEEQQCTEFSSSSRCFMSNILKEVCYEPPDGQGACKGDSGGPLYQTFETADKKVHRVLSGVTARGTCPVEKADTHASIWSSVSYYLQWIESHISGRDRDELIVVDEPALPAVLSARAKGNVNAKATRQQRMDINLIDNGAYVEDSSRAMGRGNSFAGILTIFLSAAI